MMRNFFPNAQCWPQAAGWALSVAIAQKLCGPVRPSARKNEKGMAIPRKFEAVLTKQEILSVNNWTG